MVGGHESNDGGPKQTYFQKDDEKCVGVLDPTPATVGVSWCLKRELFVPQGER